jgi:hypothetical protein
MYFMVCIYRDECKNELMLILYLFCQAITLIWSDGTDRLVFIDSDCVLSEVELNLNLKSVKLLL